MPSVDEILARLGGADAAARLTGVGHEAIRKWRQSNQIPAKHWPVILQATGLTLADMPGAAPTRPNPEDTPMPNTPPEGANAALVLADGSVFWGRGIGAHGSRVGEICFNTSMTGYQEVLTDPSYAGQIITFTFPHIGNVGTNQEDMEGPTPVARGLIVKQDITEPASWRSHQHLRTWLIAHKVTGIAGVDTRALTALIRDKGPQTGVVIFPENGAFDIPAAQAEAKAWPGLEGMDLAKEASCTQTYEWNQTRWSWPDGFGTQTNPKHHVVAVDFGAKRNILRCLAASGCRVTVVPATASAEDILRHKPDGVFLSNGPGDPAATGEYAVPVIRELLNKDMPIFGICLGHQLLARALGAQTYKMEKGHRGANQPVKDLSTNRVEITSQNHGFAVNPDTLPKNAKVTHISLFDGSNEGIACTDKLAFSVQYHPEATPGPTDSHYLFKRFVKMIETRTPQAA